MENRYIRNLTTISDDDMKILKKSKVLVVGCGGLGGYIIEMLSRIGIGNITVLDGDVFDETNLNRQLFSATSNIGRKKVVVAEERIKDVNPQVKFTGYDSLFSENNSDEIIKGHDIVVDAVDNVSTRLLMERKCSQYNIPLIHGAIAGWYYQISVVMPGDNTLSKIYSDSEEKGIETLVGNPSYTPAAAAAAQVSECIKVLLHKEIELRGKLLYVDLLNNTYNIFKI
jgi:molybdopterin/thiamine biosynthesis adenylyltransferase